MRKLKVGEVAEVLGVSASTVRRMTESGEIKSERLTNGYRVYDQKAVAKVLKRMQTPQATSGDWAPNELITGEEACTVLGISRETLRRWEQAGRIASERRHGRKLFHPETVKLVADQDRSLV